MIAPDIIAIVPFFNRRNTILAALESVRLQSHRPAQLIVVDDGSTDGGEEAVRQWMRQTRGSINCRLIQQANSGVAAARNLALSQADPTDFVAFLDSDDIWPADFLERASAALAADPCAVAATCDRQFIFADGTPSEITDCSRLAADPILWMIKFGAGISSATLFRSQAVRNRGGFPNLATGEDAALFMRLSLDGPWRHVPGEPVVFQVGTARKHGDEGHLSEKFTDNRRSWAKMYEEFFTCGDGRELVKRPEFHQAMALVWDRAGEELWDTHAPREVLACFLKSFAWNPWRRRCCWRLLHAWVRTIGHSAPAEDVEGQTLAAQA